MERRRTGAGLRGEVPSPPSRVPDDIALDHRQHDGPATPLRNRFGHRQGDRIDTGVLGSVHGNEERLEAAAAVRQLPQRGGRGGPSPRGWAHAGPWGETHPMALDGPRV